MKRAIVTAAVNVGAVGLFVSAVGVMGVPAVIGGLIVGALVVSAYASGAE